MKKLQLPKKPEYNKCNKGHEMKLIYLYGNIFGYDWDCPRCMNDSTFEYTFRIVNPNLEPMIVDDYYDEECA